MRARYQCTLRGHPIALRDSHIGEPEFILNPDKLAVPVTGSNPGGCTMHTVQYKRHKRKGLIQVDILLLDDQPLLSDKS